MLTFRGTNVTKEKFHAATNKTIKVWDVNVDNIVISKLIETKTNSKYFIRYLERAIWALVLIMPKISVHVKAFNVKETDKDENDKLKKQSEKQ